MWFYVLFTIPIVVMFPFLVASIVSEKAIIILRWHAFGKFILFGMGFTIKSKSQVLEPDKSYMIVANHTSMTDIMLMLATVKTLCFCWKSR
jgi:1-acyl-sn-glycerol-3-phosphate acyltransferase